ncbi:MAG TPA: HAMP domain-containing protein, partial [Steroidobacteraceae bacterium]
MNRLIRSSALTWALGYVLLGLAALGAFAVVLWYAWNVTIFVAREEILRDDAQRLADRFNRDGVAGLTAYLDARVGMQIAGERTLLLTDAAHHRLAGNIAAWPQGVPDQPGTHAALLELDGKPTRMLLVRTPLPGGYQLLVGRDLAFFVPLEIRFIWGLIAAVTFLCVVGIAGAILMRRQLLSRVEGLRQTVAAIMQGDLRRRLPIGPGGGELDTLSQTLNGMLDHIEYLIRGISNVSNSIAHDLRT